MAAAESDLTAEIQDWLGGWFSKRPPPISSDEFSDAIFDSDDERIHKIGWMCLWSWCTSVNVDEFVDSFEKWQKEQNARMLTKLLSDEWPIWFDRMFLLPVRIMSKVGAEAPPVYRLALSLNQLPSFPEVPVEGDPGSGVPYLDQCANWGQQNKPRVESILREVAQLTPDDAFLVAGLCYDKFICLVHFTLPPVVITCALRVFLKLRTEHLDRFRDRIGDWLVYLPSLADDAVWEATLGLIRALAPSWNNPQDLVDNPQDLVEVMLEEVLRVGGDLIRAGKAIEFNTRRWNLLIAIGRLPQEVRDSTRAQVAIVKCLSKLMRAMDPDKCRGEDQFPPWSSFNERPDERMETMRSVWKERPHTKWCEQA